MTLPYQFEPKWYAVYTYPNAERKVQGKVKEMGVEAFLPMQTVVRQWSDRKKKLEVPVFPGYVFVKTSLVDRFGLLRIKELVRFISFGDTPVAIPDREIETVRKVVARNVEVSQEPFEGRVGEKVQITGGQFEGAVGVLVNRKGRNRLVIQLEALQQAISVEVTSDCVTTTY
jgi:transcription antitermination factor NusG